MSLYGVVRATGQSPDQVREWAWPDVVHFLAYCELESEASRPSSSAPRAPSSGRSTNTIIYRVRPPVKE
jgi:hypothetical protein